MDLTSKVNTIPLVGAYYQKKLENLGIYNVFDLLHHIPRKYQDLTRKSLIKNINFDEAVNIVGKVISFKNQYTRNVKKIQIAEISDSSGEIYVIWFNQPYLSNIIKEGDTFSFSGKVSWFGRKPALISPDYEKVNKKIKLIHTQGLVPIYPETYGLSSKWLRGKIKYSLDFLHSFLKEYIPKDILSKYDLMDFKNAILNVHFPKNLSYAQKARERLAFNELLSLQVSSLKKKAIWNKTKSVANIKVDKKIIDKFIDNLPFKLTESQNKAVNEILEDLSSNIPANRLLEGDVGSGKTVVAAIAAFALFTQGYRSVFMAPTQILAHQHYETLKELFLDYKIRLSLATSGTKIKDTGTEDILVGTHSLLSEKESFEKTALVVIDEQQKFGVAQRELLVKKASLKGKIPHILTLTATPIPRTVALTFYGEMDLSQLKSIPGKSDTITTWLVPPSKRDSAYVWIDKLIKKEKVQAYIVCPHIEESEKETVLSVKSVKKEYLRLKKIFKDLKLGLLHGKLKQKEKLAAIDDFRMGKTDILVSTPVVEVGIDIKNAAIMVIEGAERYGLSSLHQLRGRVGRGVKKSYCLIFTDSPSIKVNKRLTALTKNLNGFELAELDLKLRGPGEIFGTKQHGIPELRIATWQDFTLIKKAKDAALQAFKNKSLMQDILKYSFLRTLPV